MVRGRTLGAVFIVLMFAPAVQGEVIWHDPWLNWDFINQNPIGVTIPVNDFAVIVDATNWVPQEQWAAPFQNFQTTAGDYDADGDMDTMCKWSMNVGEFVQPNEIAHGGLYMKGSGLVLDAYWTLDCNKVYVSTPVTYELTEIRGEPEVHMHLNMAPGYFNDPEQPGYPYAEAGWTNIRTFVNIPAELLGLEDLNRELDLDLFADYEVTPIDAETGLPISPTDQIWRYEGESFFDVFLSEIDPEYASPEYEALLHADVITPGGARQQMVGEFWNLNPQSPEPGTLSLLALAGLALLRRRRA